MLAESGRCGGGSQGLERERLLRPKPVEEGVSTMCIRSREMENFNFNSLGHLLLRDLHGRAPEGTLASGRIEY